MDRYEWCGVEPGSEVKNVSGRGRKNRAEEKKKQNHLLKLQQIMAGRLLV